MTKLVPLSNIPHSARDAERVARSAYPSAAAALEAAHYRLDVAPGCHGRPYFDAPVIGWVCTRQAAEAMCERLTHMPGGTSHRRVACGQLTSPAINDAEGMQHETKEPDSH